MLLEGRYVAVAIDKSGIEAAVNQAVAAFQRRHKGQLPRYVWCPVGQLPAIEHVQSWSLRNVVISPHPSLSSDVRAGPED